jgi:hypothetical protein
MAFPCGNAMGWLLWNVTRILGLLAIAIFGSLLFFFVWLAFEAIWLGSRFSFSHSHCSSWFRQYGIVSLRLTFAGSRRSRYSLDSISNVSAPVVRITT